MENRLTRDDKGNPILGERFIWAEDGEGQLIILDTRTMERYYGTMDYQEVWI